MIRTPIAMLVVATVLLSGCWRTPPSKLDGPKGEQFLLFSTPRDFDVPGSILRLDGGGTYWRVTRLTVTPNQGRAFLPKVTSMTTLSLVALIDALGGNKNALSGVADAELNRTRDFTTESTEGTRFYLDDRQVDLLLANCESFFATLECELLDRRRFPTQAEARMAVFDFIEGWYNPHRRHSGLDYQSPIRYELRHPVVA